MKKLLAILIALPLLVSTAFAGGLNNFGAFNLDWSGGNNSRLAFYSPFTSTLSVLTPPRAYPGTTGIYTGASARYVYDHESVLRKVESGSIAIPGSRIVTNLLTYSEDLSNAAWLLSGITKDGNILHFTGVSTNKVYRAVSVAVGTVTLSIKFSPSDTDKSIRLAIYNKGAYDYGSDITIPASGRVARTFTASGSGIAYIGIANSSSAPEQDITVVNAQLENVTGLTNQNPGEYVKTTSAAVTKCFSTLNGNTVDANGVVTEETGAAIFGIKGPLFEVASTNKVTAYGIIPADTLGSELITNAADREFSSDTGFWTKSGTTSISGGTCNIVGDSNQGLYRAGLMTKGKVYQAAYTITSITTGGLVVKAGLTSGTTRTTPGTYTDNIVCGDASTTLGFYAAEPGTSLIVDNVSLKEVGWAVGTKSYWTGSAFQQNITGLTLSGDTAGSTSIQDGTTVITSSGLLSIDPTGKIYETDNTAGSTDSVVTISGTVGNTNKHSLQIRVLKVTGAGTPTIALTGGIGATNITDTTTYALLKSENVTPAASDNQFIITVPAGCKIRFLMPQMTEATSCSSYIPTAGATATRAATSLSYPTSGIWGTTLGSELITVEDDRTFASDTGYWTKGSGVTIGSGVVTYSAVTGKSLYKAAGLTSGKSYQVTFTITGYSSGSLYVDMGTGKQSNGGTAYSANGTYSATIVADSQFISWKTTTSGVSTLSLDNVSVKEVQSVPSGSGTFYWTPNALNASSARYLWGSYADANNSIGLYYDGTNVVFRKRVGGSNFDATKALTAVAGTTYRIGWRINADYSTDLAVDGTLGTGSADTTAPAATTTFKIGDQGDGNNGLLSSQIKDFKIYRKALPDSLMYLDWKYRTPDNYFMEAAA